MKKSNLSILIFALAILFFSAGLFFRPYFDKDDDGNPGTQQNLGTKVKMIGIFNVKELIDSFPGQNECTHLTFYNAIERPDGPQSVLVTLIKENNSCPCLKSEKGDFWLLENIFGKIPNPKRINFEEARRFRDNLAELSARYPRYSASIDIRILKEQYGKYGFRYVGVYPGLTKEGRATLDMYFGEIEKNTFQVKKEVEYISEPCPIACPTTPDRNCALD